MFTRKVGRLFATRFCGMRRECPLFTSPAWVWVEALWQNIKLTRTARGNNLAKRRLCFFPQSGFVIGRAPAKFKRSRQVQSPHLGGLAFLFGGLTVVAGG